MEIILKILYWPFIIGVWAIGAWVGIVVLGAGFAVITAVITSIVSLFKKKKPPVYPVDRPIISQEEARAIYAAKARQLGILSAPTKPASLEPPPQDGG